MRTAQLGSQQQHTWNEINELRQTRVHHWWWSVAHHRRWRSMKPTRHSQMSISWLQQHTRSWMFGQLRTPRVGQICVEINHLQKATCILYTPHYHSYSVKLLWLESLTRNEFVISGTANKHFCIITNLLWHCSLGIRKSTWPLKMSNEVLARLSVCRKVQMICIWYSWCHCNPIISCFIKIQTGLTFLLVPAYSGCPGRDC